MMFTRWHHLVCLQADAVVLMPCFLLCVCAGATGVGLNELKRKLLISDPQHFSVTIPRKFT